MKKAKLMNRILSVALFVAMAACGQLTVRAQEARILSIRPEGREWSIMWSGPAGWNHSLQYSSTLPAARWQEVVSVPSASAVNQQHVSPPAGAAQGFYRIVYAAPAGAPGPRLFFSDLESGPNRGGQDDLGCFITLWGEGFGAARGDSKVTIGGQEVARYVEWGEDTAWARKPDMIVVQPGPEVVSGNIEVIVNGKKSNPLPFTVRAGQIYFVSTLGDDANSGEFQSPFRTLPKTKDTLAAGDIAYLMDGVRQTEEENHTAALIIEQSGEPGKPKALIGYPGAHATIGSTNLEYGLRVITDPDKQANDWLVSKLVLRGHIQAMELGAASSSRWRIIGNDISCPDGDGQTGCFAASLASHIAFLGNHVHDVSSAGPQPSKQYHAVYFTTDTSHVEVGWNHIHDNRTCRALQFHSSPLCLPDCGPTDTTGFNQFDLRIHDNLIHGDTCDGINLATVDPSKGPVLVYNNIIFDVGRGPSPPDGDANYAGIHVAAGTNNGPDGTGVVEIFNNTLYDCGSRKLLPDSIGDDGMLSRAPGSPNLIMRLRNNIIYAIRGEDYIAPSSDISLITGSNNLWFGSGTAPDFLQNNLNADPRFTDLAARNFSLLPDSPAINRAVDVGVESVSPLDYLGVQRPQGATADLGAVEFTDRP